MGFLEERGIELDKGPTPKERYNALSRKISSIAVRCNDEGSVEADLSEDTRVKFTRVHRNSWLNPVGRAPDTDVNVILIEDQQSQHLGSITAEKSRLPGRPAHPIGFKAPGDEIMTFIHDEPFQEPGTIIAGDAHLLATLTVIEEVSLRKLK